MSETRGTQAVTAAYDGYGRLTGYSRAGAEAVPTAIMVWMTG
jgi:hypothetical protein